MHEHIINKQRSTRHLIQKVPNDDLEGGRDDNRLR